AATPEPSSEPERASTEPEESPEPAILSESISFRAETPSSISSETFQPSERRSRAGRALISVEQASQARREAEQARRDHQQALRGRGRARGSNAIQPVFSSFFAGSAHRLHRRDLPP